MVARFIASPPADQNTETYRQFQRLQGYLANLETRLAPLFGRATVNPLVLTDAWQPLTLVQPAERAIPTEQAAYFVSMRLQITGSTANALAQLRISSGGESVTGDEVSIGNNTLESVTITASLFLGQGEVLLEARGITCEILAGRFDIHRIGAGP